MVGGLAVFDMSTLPIAILTNETVAIIRISMIAIRQMCAILDSLPRRGKLE